DIGSKDHVAPLEIEHAGKQVDGGAGVLGEEQRVRVRASDKGANALDGGFRLFAGNAGLGSGAAVQRAIILQKFIQSFQGLPERRGSGGIIELPHFYQSPVGKLTAFLRIDNLWEQSGPPLEAATSDVFRYRQQG